MNHPIQMVDLKNQYKAIKDEIDYAIQDVIDNTAFIKGPAVTNFESALAKSLGGKFAVGVGNGTDALQVAMMAAGIGPGDEVITSPFTFIATAEAAALLGATAVFADIKPDTFNIDPASIEALITPKTKAIVPVHIFGQPADMDPIMEIASRHNLIVIEDNAQGVGALYKGKYAGYIGHMGTLSFFPSKNLGCYGDGGAVLTNDPELHQKIRMIANHGSQKKYHNEIIGVNSRLDTIQAAVLGVKLNHLEKYTAARQVAASIYDNLLADVDGITIPFRSENCTHVFHQYTLRVEQTENISRDGLVDHLRKNKIPCAVYYPVPLHKLPVFDTNDQLPETDRACAEVMSLPMHTELTKQQQQFIVDTIQQYIETALHTPAAL